MLEIMNGVRKGGVGITAEITGIRFVFLEPGVRSLNTASSYIGIYSVELHNQGVYYPNTSVVASASSRYSTSYHENLVINYRDNSGSYWCTASGNDGNPGRSCWLQLTFPKRQITGFDIYFNFNYQCKNFDVEVQLPSGEWVYATTMRRISPWDSVAKDPLKTIVRNNKSSARQSSMAFNEQGLNLPLNLGPGPQSLIGYYIDPINPFRQHGFFGEVASGSFITGDSLASLVGLTSGNSINSTTAWLKFLIDGKIVYIPKLSLRNSINWQQIYQAGCVYADNTNGLYPSGTPVLQNKQVMANGYSFKVGLISAVRTDPSPISSSYDPVITHGSEWNRLFYNICVNHATYKQNSQEGDEWANYTELELGSVSVAGNAMWCKETVSTATGSRAWRGSNTITRISSQVTTSSTSASGWRPKLELYSLHEI